MKPQAKNKNIKTLFGSLLLAVIVAIHLYVAANYYFISNRNLSDFLIWQTNTEPNNNPK
jgi:uncharacterized membrane protein YfhO